MQEGVAFACVRPCRISQTGKTRRPAHVETAVAAPGPRAANICPAHPARTMNCCLMRKYGLPASIRPLVARSVCHAPFMNNCTALAGTFAMNVTQDFHHRTVLHASLVVKLVMLLLTLVSLTSCTGSSARLRHSRRGDQDGQVRTGFLERRRPQRLYQSAVTIGTDRRAGAHLEAGYREFTKLRGQKTIDPTAVVDGARRAMRRHLSAAKSTISRRIWPFLASVGSVSPYVGLFGTGVGHHARLPRTGQHEHGDAVRRRTGDCGGAVATAIGLFAAIPAVIAYNRFAHDVDECGALAKAHGRVFQHPAAPDTMRVCVTRSAANQRRKYRSTALFQERGGGDCPPNGHRASAFSHG